MRDPIVSNVREGLPPCQHYALYGNRVASLVDTSKCDDDHTLATRFFIVAGIDGDNNPSDPHSEYLAGQGSLASCLLRVETDDPAEAQAAFERGAEWVRTGVGP